MRFMAATTFSRLDLLILKHSLAFWTLCETIRMQLMFRNDPVPCEAFHPPVNILTNTYIYYIIVTYFFSVSRDASLGFRQGAITGSVLNL